MELSQRPSSTGGERFKELNGSRNDDRIVPQVGQMSSRKAVEFRTVMVGCNDAVGILVCSDEGLLIDAYRLINDIGIRQDDKNSPQFPLSGYVQQVVPSIYSSARTKLD